MGSHSKNHDYHLVEPSPWPIIGSIGAFIMAIGAIGLMRWNSEENVFLFGFDFSNPWLFVIGTLIIIYTMFMWWRDIIHEGEYEGHHTPVVLLHLRYGMLLFIASEVMFFVAWFWAYFDASLMSGHELQVDRVAHTGGIWPPKDIVTFDPFDLPLINTLILLTSGTTVTWAHHALIEGDRDGLKWGLLCTVLLGVLFTFVQAYEYSHAAFNYSGNIYGATFFMATGFHGFHVIIGTIFLIICLFRALAGHFRPEDHFGFEAAAWYWHFVDVVWLFLFICIYIWGG